jgi:hypothetical protein
MLGAGEWLSSARACGLLRRPVNVAYIARNVTMIDPEKERQRLAQAYAGMSEGELEKLADEAWSLTEPAREALKAELSQRKLPITLRDSAEEKRETSKIIILQRYTNLPVALVAKSILDSAGIESFLADENVIRIDWFLSNALGGIKLCVREEDAEAAAALLEHRHDST